MQPQKIGKYTVTFPIKKGKYAESYRVTDDSGKKFFLKMINLAKLSEQQYTDYSKVITELEITRDLAHPNVIHTVESGEVVIDGQKYSYALCDYIVGETLQEKVARERHCSVYDIKCIISGVLNGLKYLHKGETPVIHNDITAHNIMLDMSKSTLMPVIIDFGHAQKLTADNTRFYTEGLNPFYLASEMFHGVYSTRTDLYSVGVLMYYLLFGMFPWYVDLDDVPVGDRIKRILEERNKPLQIPDVKIFELTEDLLNIVAKALSQDVDQRFQSANEFLMALNGEITVRGVKYEKTDIKKEQESGRSSSPKVKVGNGFADVAGLSDLKKRLQTEVIDLLKNPERYKKLRVQIPNGILLYGPPGCGKTFIAEKFAEEIGCNYMYVHCSDVASPYIHGGQEKIATVFSKAKKNAPTVMFLDELDAMITDRALHNNASEYGEVNEFLTQLNNCSEHNVIVIGATNNPQRIDPAALRSGRLDIKVFVPAPDTETREELFKLYLKDIDADDVDYNELARRTEGYVSKDIASLVNKAALITGRQGLDKVTMAALEEALDASSGELPSVSSKTLKQFENIRDEFEGRKTRRPIGFN